MGWRRQRGLSLRGRTGAGSAVWWAAVLAELMELVEKQSPSQEADQRFVESGGLRVKVPLLS